MTQKSESVRESEQRKLAEALAHAEGLIHRGTDLPREDVVEVMLDFANSEIERLAEEAEHEVLTKVQYSDCRMYWRSFAAWLREKAL